jgi:16S rRNA (cytidine1402-2'-O)-methyltransferase
MRGTLFVVATPIGNLEDVTLRALRVLREVTVVAAEDTRRTARLLQHYSISTSTTSLHEHNEHARTPNLIHRLLGGESIALVSDAGTPVISDPGTRLIAEAHRHSIRVEPIPGPSAVIAALSASGISGDGFVFAGFPPSRAKARILWLKALGEEERPVVFFEAPHRIRATVDDLASLFAGRKVAIARELTKIHEKLAVRPISDWVLDPPVDRGEFTLVIEPQPTGAKVSTARPTDARVATDFVQLTKSRTLNRRAAIRELSSRYGISNREVFSALERHKKLGVQPK